MIKLDTFSVAARCPRTGMLGVGVSTAVPAVGGMCHLSRRVLARSRPNPGSIPIWHRRLEADRRAACGRAALEQADCGGSRPRGPSARHRRRRRRRRRLHRHGMRRLGGAHQSATVCVQGNMLVGAATIAAMAAAARGTAALNLPERLMLLLEAGQAAGGDKRGKQSAGAEGLNVEQYPWLDIRVDDIAPGCGTASHLRGCQAPVFCPS